MILGFKIYFPWGEETLFQEKIISPFVDMTAGDYEGRNFDKLSLHKIHTIRAGNRIKPGMFLHMATGVRTKNYFQFNESIPELQKCKATQGIRIFTDVREVWVARKEKVKRSRAYDYGFVKVENLRPLAFNDGVTEEQFWKFFRQDLVGQIIHWTDLRYF